MALKPTSHGPRVEAEGREERRRGRPRYDGAGKLRGSTFSPGKGSRAILPFEDNFQQTLRTLRYRSLGRDNVVPFEKPVLCISQG